MQLPPTTPAHILVVDDEPDLRTLYELTLLREGYRVEAAGDLLQAREQLESKRFDAVITDMRLPDGSGLDVLAWIEQQQPARREKAIEITAYGSAENAVEALKAGAYDYLTKPVDLRQYRSVVASALPQSTTRTSSAHATLSIAAPICAASLSVMMVTEHFGIRLAGPRVRVARILPERCLLHGLEVHE